MSAFVMEKEGFVQLANELTMRVEFRNNPLNWEVCQFLGIQSHAVPDNVLPFAAQKCQELYEANIRAVNERYDEDTPEDEPAAQLQIKPRMFQWTDLQLFKALRCLRYQMSEGDVPETDIYKALDKLIGEIAQTLISNSPAYDAANWGWGQDARRRAA